MSHDVSVAQLPLELLNKIGSFLPFKDRLQFSATNTQLRQIFVPELFSTVRVTSNREDAGTIQHILNKFGQHIHAVSVKCHLQEGLLHATEREDESNNRDDAQIGDSTGTGDKRFRLLPEVVVKLLSGETLNHLQAITIHFLPHNDYEGQHWGDSEGIGGIYIHSESESEEEVLQQEKTMSWRKLMFEIWSALVANTSILYLEILRLPPREISVWRTAKWESFLSRLQHLSIGIWGGEGAGWHSNTHYAYLDFLFRLHEYFFAHSSNLVHLEIVADEGNPYGGENMHQSPLALLPDNLTKVKILELRNCIIDENLIKFLEARSRTLQQLALYNCTACIGEYVEGEEMTWANFFRNVHATQPMLEVLSVVNTVVPVSEDERCPRPWQRDEKGIFIPPEDEPENIKEIRRSVKSNGRKLFSYVSIDDKYGMIFDDEEENISNFETGDDQREYDNLISFVQQNASAARDSSGGVNARSSDNNNNNRDEGAGSRLWRTKRT